MLASPTSLSAHPRKKKKEAVLKPAPTFRRLPHAHYLLANKRTPVQTYRLYILSTGWRRHQHPSQRREHATREREKKRKITKRESDDPSSTSPSPITAPGPEATAHHEMGACLSLQGVHIDVGAAPGGAGSRTVQELQSGNKKLAIGIWEEERYQDVQTREAFSPLAPAPRRCLGPLFEMFPSESLFGTLPLGLKSPYRVYRAFSKDTPVLPMLALAANQARRVHSRTPEPCSRRISASLHPPIPS